jgi:menaquinol-cytochrome c reductase iron-sulfur subunit
MNEPKKAADLPNPGRRDFVKRVWAGIIGGVITLVPALTGLRFLLDPLHRKTGAGTAVRVASLEALPEDGIPRRFQVIADKTDAWNKFTGIPVGAVYLRRLKGGQLQAFNASCPHAGCSVSFEAKGNVYSCPCHKSTFDVAGAILDRSSPASRGLDSLDVELRGGKEIWVKFQNFQAGRPEKVPLA